MKREIPPERIPIGHVAIGEEPHPSDGGDPDSNYEYTDDRNAGSRESDRCTDDACSEIRVVYRNRYKESASLFRPPFGVVFFFQGMVI